MRHVRFSKKSLKTFTTYGWGALQNFSLQTTIISLGEGLGFSEKLRWAGAFLENVFFLNIDWLRNIDARNIALRNIYVFCCGKLRILSFLVNLCVYLKLRRNCKKINSLGTLRNLIYVELSI